MQNGTGLRMRSSRSELGLPVVTCHANGSPSPHYEQMQMARSLQQKNISVCIT